jgi:hypothetical protein
MSLLKSLGHIVIHVDLPAYLAVRNHSISFLIEAHQTSGSGRSQNLEVRYMYE